jgi:arginine decarboxylase
MFNNKIPNEYFLTVGSGESNLKSKSNETTSFDAALVDAGIGNVNVITYSSMIPPKAKEVPRGVNNWGEVMDCIISRKDGTYKQKISVGIMIVDVINPQGLKLGGFAMEYTGKDSYTVSKGKLTIILKDMVYRRNYGTLLESFKTDLGYSIIPKNYIFKSMTIKKKYGTVIAAICFKNYYT